MENILNNIGSGFGVTDVIDILIITFIAYKALQFIKQSRAQQLVKGILILVILYAISSVLNLHTLNWLLSSTLTIGVFALIVIFQPELRRALEYMGRSKLISKGLRILDDDRAHDLVGEFSKAATDLSESRTGALIVIEREIPLKNIVETGTIIDAKVTAQLLENIFYEGAPLHDGAAIIKIDRVFAAGCVLPLTEDKELNKKLGTRHRAGIGISEESDAIVIIVSEETGVISVAMDGELSRNVKIKDLENILLNYYTGKLDKKLTNSVIDKFSKKKGGKKDAK